MDTFNLKFLLLIVKCHPVSQWRYSLWTLNICYKMKYHLGIEGIAGKWRFKKGFFSKHYQFLIQIFARSFTCTLNNPIQIVVLDLKNLDMSKNCKGSRNLRSFHCYKTIGIAKLTHIYLNILGSSRMSRKYALRLLGLHVFPNKREFETLKLGIFQCPIPKIHSSNMDKTDI